MGNFIGCYFGFRYFNCWYNIVLYIIYIFLKCFLKNILKKYKIFYFKMLRIFIKKGINLYIDFIWF